LISSKTGCCVNYQDLEVPKIRKQGLYITRGVSHCGLAIYIKKYLKAKEELNYGNSNISPCQKYNLQNIL
jgi:hypothetical protein